MQGLPKNPNPLDELNDKRKYLCSVNNDDLTTTDLYVKIITDVGQMRQRRDCTDLVKLMFERLGRELGSEWADEYEQGQLVDVHNSGRLQGWSCKCPEQNSTYMVLEDQNGKAVALGFGDFYPNKAFEGKGYSKLSADTQLLHMRNFVMKEKPEHDTVSKAIEQLFLSKIFTLAAKRHGNDMYMTSVISNKSIIRTPEEKKAYEEFVSQVSGLTSDFVEPGKKLYEDKNDPNSKLLVNNFGTDGLLLVRRDKDVPMTQVLENAKQYRKELVRKYTSRLEIDREKKEATKGVFGASK